MREFYIFPRFWGKVREGVRPICEIKSPPPKTETVKCGQIRSNREFKSKTTVKFKSVESSQVNSKRLVKSNTTVKSEAVESDINTETGNHNITRKGSTNSPNNDQIMMSCNDNDEPLSLIPEDCNRNNNSDDEKYVK